MLDRLSPWGRYLLILGVLLPVAAYAGAIALAVITQGGVSGIDWPAQQTASLDAAAVSAAGGITTWIALYLTPLTRQFGPGKTRARRATMKED